MAAQDAVAPTGREPAAILYSPSWVDHLTHGIARLAGPAWGGYLLLLVGLVILINALNWIGGRYPAPTLDPLQSAYAVYAVYMLALIQHLNGVAGSAIASFRPALEVNASEYQRIRSELTSLPAREGALAGLAGLAFVGIMYVADLPDASTLHPAVLIGTLAVEAFTIAVFAVLIYHTVHQLRLVSRIHALASRIDLFDPPTLHAFSTLTARTGIGLVLLLTYSYLIDPSIDPVGAAMTGVVVVVAAAAFVLPLEGMHRRIVVEKERLQREADRRLQATFAELHRSVDEHDLSLSDGLNKTLLSLQSERETLARIAAWPWQPGTLRAVVTALVVPIVLWLIFRALDRFV